MFCTEGIQNKTYCIVQGISTSGLVKSFPCWREFHLYKGTQLSVWPGNTLASFQTLLFKTKLFLKSPSVKVANEPTFHSPCQSAEKGGWKDGGGGKYLYSSIVDGYFPATFIRGIFKENRYPASYGPWTKALCTFYQLYQKNLALITWERYSAQDEGAWILPVFPEVETSSMFPETFCLETFEKHVFMGLSRLRFPEITKLVVQDFQI